VLRVDERVARCLHMLRSQEFSPLVDWLRHCKDDSLDKLTQADGNQIYRLQGEAGVLKEVIELIAQSDKLIEKLRR
jgi:hypothetical protein